MKLFSLLFVLVATIFMVATSSFAVDPGKFTYQADRSGRSGTHLHMSQYTNQAVTGPSASVSATCPDVATKVIFQPAETAGNYRLKANGSGVPGSTAVTDGTGWMKNWSAPLDINVSVSGTTISSYAVWTSVSDTVPYTCFAR